MRLLEEISRLKTTAKQEIHVLTEEISRLKAQSESSLSESASVFDALKQEIHVLQGTIREANLAKATLLENNLISASSDFELLASKATADDSTSETGGAVTQLESEAQIKAQRLEREAVKASILSLSLTLTLT